ncbi:tRNA threonylcarbamoyladenosine dehydratase [Helicovermis profundi]|uniref:tRNA threonylcarbamoyladenosine dehydratase n=1 Tax=Helicovermis profundi TaxID=3065157 RepID=A0AAU9E5A5_9FIRM|nr:tRNA threonylcarbamoyladenosine dehydratase [Clostridia bacterium S502]
MLHAFSRTEMVIGTEALDKLKKVKIAIIGIGGVGSYVAEGLARMGVGNFILCDDDDICLTNINRQIHATRKTVGKLKVEVMKERILDINPRATVEIFPILYKEESSEKIIGDDCDYVVDAIDMVTSKLNLIEVCYKKNIPIISSMGMGNKINPTMIEVADIHKTSMCPLARVMRRELKKRRIRKLKVVYSKEKPRETFVTDGDCKNNCICTNKDRTCENRRSIPGSVSFVPSVAGLIIASEVVKDIINLDEKIV